MDTIDLERLITESKNGDAESFRVLVAHLDTKLFSYVSIRIQSRDEALELVQDVLVDVWKSLRTFRYTSDAGFYRFVYTIAKRHLYRSWGAPKTLSLDALPEQVAEPLVTPDNTPLFVFSLIKTLEKTAQEIIVLHHWSGFNFKEIATMLGMKETAVRVRHHRALDHLRNLLKPHA